MNCDTWLLTIDEERYGRRGRPDLIKKAQERWPKRITVEGTLEQAEYVAATLSYSEPGCNDFWQVEEGNASERTIENSN